MVALANTYLGPPGNLQLIPTPSVGMAAVGSKKTVLHSLAGGGTTTTRRKSVKYQWDMQWSNLTPDQVDILRLLWSGAFGAGPYKFVNLDQKNKIGYDSSIAGQAIGAVPDSWFPSVGALAYYTNVAVPKPVVGSGVVSWTGAGASSYFTTQTPSGACKGATAAPVIAGQAVTYSFYARTVSGTATLSANILNCNDTDLASTGTNLVTGGTQAVISTGWTRISVTWNGAGVTKNFLIPQIVNASAGAPVILIGGMQIEYGDIVTSWLMGSGSPRIAFASDEQFDVQLVNMKSLSLTFVEV